ncbi:hypothetical protein M0R04_12740 [Candidatus Dojkabacteria bacterium]|jgi:hypothetical protein|nr:hypothetical protein [Candidatus Dojkabacteria bacterium]
MAAPIANDRNLGAEVRRLTLGKIKKVLEDEDNSIYGKEFQQALILRLAGTVLPRLNELTGEGGGSVVIQIAKEISDKNVIAPSPEGNSN